MAAGLPAVPGNRCWLTNISAVIAKRGSLGIAKELFATGTTSRKVEGTGDNALSAPQSLAAKPVDGERAREPGKLLQLDTFRSTNVSLISTNPTEKGVDL